MRVKKSKTKPEVLKKYRLRLIRIYDLKPSHDSMKSYNSGRRNNPYFKEIKEQIDNEHIQLQFQI